MVSLCTRNLPRSLVPSVSQKCVSLRRNAAMSPWVCCPLIWDTQGCLAVTTLVCLLSLLPLTSCLSFLESSVSENKSPNNILPLLPIFFIKFKKKWVHVGSCIDSNVLCFLLLQHTFVVVFYFIFLHTHTEGWGREGGSSPEVRSDRTVLLYSVQLKYSEMEFRSYVGIRTSDMVQEDWGDAKGLWTHSAYPGWVNHFFHSCS